MTKNEIGQFKANMFFRILYVLSFNLYSWYWMYKIIWNNDSTWEDYLNWFFVVCGVHFFVIDYSKFWSKNVKSIKDIFNPEIK